MAEKDCVKIEDEVELQIIASFGLLIDCLNKRRAQILSQYRDRRDQVRSADASRKQSLQQLTETKLDLQSKMKSNELHSTWDKMLSEVESKIKELEKEETDINEEIQFEYDVKFLEENISQFGKLTSVNEKSEPCTSTTDSQEICQSSGQSSEVLEVNNTSLNFDKKLSSDAIAEMWEGHLNDNKKVLIKRQLQEDSILTKDSFMREVETLNKLSHDSIVKMYAVCREETPVSIVYEFMSPLTEFLRSGDGAMFVEPKLVNICTQVAAAMTYLESRSCIHRDVAARNVFVGDDGQVKLCGFTLAVFLDGKFYQGNADEIFPIKWSACETILYSRCTVKSDVWSFGVFMWEVLTFGCHPYPGLDNEQVKDQVIPPRNLRLAKPTGCSDSLYQLMLKCWSSDPGDRPSFENVKNQLEAITALPQDP